MHHQKNDAPPAGVVPRRHAQSLDALMSDAPDRWTVAEEVESPGSGQVPPLTRWLSSAVTLSTLGTLGVVASAFDWLKLTR